MVGPLLAGEIRMHKLTQFLFFEQWQRVRDACRSRRIVIMGDLPIFVAHDSADVWARRELFRLDARRPSDGGRRRSSGLLQRHRTTMGQSALPVGRARTKRLHLVDRALPSLFSAWSIGCASITSAGSRHPGKSRRDATTAMEGEWVKGPGAALFDVMQSALGVDRLPFVAENLGVITPEVEALRERFGLPGMAILQFAFGTDPQAPDFKPHNYPRNRVVYTGTHDNDTTVGWWTGEVGHSTRSNADLANEREHARRYLGLDGREVHWEFIRAVLASVADTAIVPAQDLLGLGSEARMNRPGTLSGNWRWRLRPGQLTADVAERLAVLAATYDRI